VYAWIHNSIFEPAIATIPTPLQIKYMSKPYYQPSGRFPLKTLLFTIIFGLIALPLAWLYSWLTMHIPFVYINFFITLGFGLGLGLIATFVAYIGKARNPMLMGLVGLVIGITGWYVQWAAWSGSVAADFNLVPNGMTYSPGTIDFAMNPGLIFTLAQNVNEVGIWKIKGATINGFFLSAAWFFEFVIIVGLPFLLGRFKAQDPFCETSLTWAEKTELSKHFAYIGDKENFLKSVEASPGNLLAFLSEHSSNESDYAQLSLYRCKGSNESYVTITNKKIQMEKDKEKTSSETIAEYLAIPPLTADDLTQHCTSAVEPQAAATASESA
jgi:hypothetical protein